MSVYIENMKMPNFGYREIRIYPDGRVIEEDECGIDEVVGTAKQVKSHGRLIDADALEDNNITYYAIPVLKNITDAAIRKAELVIRLKDIDAAPTIIPANNDEI